MRGDMINSARKGPSEFVQPVFSIFQVKKAHAFDLLRGEKLVNDLGNSLRDDARSLSPSGNPLLHSREQGHLERRQLVLGEAVVLHFGESHWVLMCAARCDLRDEPSRFKFRRIERGARDPLSFFSEQGIDAIPTIGKFVDRNGDVPLFDFNALCFHRTNTTSLSRFCHANSRIALKPS